MKSTKIWAMIGIVILGFCLSDNSMASDDKTGKAIEAAKKWVELIDQGKYGESWETAAEYFKNAAAKERWEQMLNGVRKPLGRLVSRDLKSKTYQKSLPGAPDGEYVVIQFRTSFENKKSAIETITPMLDGDGQWRVSGYYIK